MHRKKVRCANFRQLAPKMVTIATFLEDSEKKKVGFIMLTHICTYPENLVKIGPVDFEIIGLLSDR